MTFTWLFEPPPTEILVGCAVIWLSLMGNRECWGCCTRGHCCTSLELIKELPPLTAIDDTLPAGAAAGTAALPPGGKIDIFTGVATATLPMDNFDMLSILALSRVPLACNIMFPAGDAAGTDSCDTTESSVFAFDATCEPFSWTGESKDAQLSPPKDEFVGGVNVWTVDAAGCCVCVAVAALGGSGSLVKSIRLPRFALLNSTGFPSMDPMLLDDAVLYSEKPAKNYCITYFKKLYKEYTSNSSEPGSKSTGCDGSDATVQLNS